ncbi:MAG: hypothetical protein A2020_13790 [Lentisphaerae bacterium GWF2_45_14]|nr:MAG: hypothetical protein A2020_13790 [Lentisphaerae bacterium GWF2_45_14]
MGNKEKWLLWEDIDRSPFLNMAIDELLLEKSSPDEMPILRIYGWDRPSISIGYVQDFAAAEAPGYTVVRRPTGGGVVYHDKDLTYTVIIPAGHTINKLGRLDSYHVLHHAVLNALENLGHKEAGLSPDEMPPVDRATMQCFTTPTRYDVISMGRKFAGSAQRRTKKGILHQGSISLDASDGNKNLLIKTIISGFIKILALDFISYMPDDALLTEASDLAEKKYKTTEWNMGESEKRWRQT